MPELPEAEFARRLAQAHLAGKRVSDVRFVDDRVVYEGVLPAAFAGALRGRTVLEAKRWGKQLWFRMDRPPHPGFHLGMTGTFQVRGQTVLKYVSSKRDEDPEEKAMWPPRFWRAEIEMADGSLFAFTDARRFGRIRLLESPEEQPPVSEMGFDPLLAMPSLGEFSGLLTARSGEVKAVLLDQRFAAGVGNWVADEVLYQAKVHPQLRASQLSAAAARALHGALRSIVRKACEVNANSAKFPRDWLFHYRWAKREAAPKDGKGRPIKFLTSGGRTSAYVPEVQLAPLGASPAPRKGAPPRKGAAATKGLAPAKGAAATKGAPPRKGAAAKKGAAPRTGAAATKDAAPRITSRFFSPRKGAAAKKGAAGAAPRGPATRKRPAGAA